MINSFLEWFGLKINGILENIKVAFIVVFVVAFLIITLPIWILPFVFWYFFIWEKEDKEVARKTNADRIRAFSDEELAEWLTKITDDAQLDAETKCDYQWAEWLQSEVEE